MLCHPVPPFRMRGREVIMKMEIWLKEIVERKSSDKVCPNRVQRNNDSSCLVDAESNGVVRQMLINGGNRRRRGMIEVLIPWARAHMRRCSTFVCLNALEVQWRHTLIRRRRIRHLLQCWRRLRIPPPTRTPHAIGNTLDLITEVLVHAPSSPMSR